MSDPTKPHPDKPAASPPTHRSGCAVFKIGCLALLLLIGALVAIAWLGSATGGGSAQVVLDAEAKARATGVAPTLTDFQKKYPASAKGADVVDQASRIIIPAVYDYKSFSKTTGTVQYQEPRTSFDFQKLFTEATGNKPDELTTAAIYAFVTANRSVLDAITSLPGQCRYDELGWRHEFGVIPPFTDVNNNLKASGSGSYLRVRELARALLPASVYIALEDGNSSSAYTLMQGWMYHNRAMKVSGPFLVDAMIGVAVDGVVLKVLAELMHAAPPDEATAWKLYHLLDPEIMRRDLVRGYEGETIYTSQLLRHVANTSEPLPLVFGPTMTNDPVFGTNFKTRMQDLAKLVREIASGKTSPTMPSWTEVRLALFGFSQSDIHAAIATSIESLAHLKRLSGSPTVKEFEARSSALERWAEVQSSGNPVLGVVMPAFARASSNARAQRAYASVLRAGLLLRIAELRASEGTTMPRDLESVAKQLGQPTPLDPYAAKPGDTIVFKADLKSRTYTLGTRIPGGRHSGTPIESQGTWTPGTN